MDGAAIELNNLDYTLRVNIPKLSKSLDGLKNSFENSSKETQKLTKALVIWTAIMALAVMGQIVAIILTNLS